MKIKKKYLSSFFCNINGVCLDKNQIKIVTSKRKNILVLAGAGCGKTLTIVSKIKYLIKVVNVDPKDIVCISFTNDAVNKLKSDLNENKVDVMTFHKLALKILGKKREVLTENMLINIIENSFCNDVLFGLYNINKEDMYLLVQTFINLFKSKNYKLDKFYEFINKADSKDKLLLKEIMKCYICYESYLNKENLMDFNDMINLATEKLETSSIRYKYIIIDEWQDTSISKLRLIRKLQELSYAKVFAVGDDFQSIYRFTGSNINVITRFRHYFLFAKIFKLNITYRNSKELVKVAGKFIMKNKFQVKKKIKSTFNLKNPIEIIYYNNLQNSIDNILKNEDIDDLLILARNNKDLDTIKINKDICYRKMSVHKSKGLQSNYVFVINVNNNKNGFPNKYTNNNILKYVNNYKEYYPYEEERRLFYVALTRCIKKVYLFVPKNNPSIFINEIKKYKNVIKR